MKQFVYKPGPELPKLSTEEINGRRHYITPSGNHYPSVTTMLSYFKGEFLQQWRERVGQEEADRTLRKAGLRGEKFHSFMEWYLGNQPTPLNEAVPHLMPDMKQAFFDMRKYLDNIDNIRYMETALYSDTMRLAGRTDVIAEYNGELSVIDFKTSLKRKKENWIQDYFHQATIYALMHQEMTGVPIKQIVIMISVDGDPDPQVFVRRTRNYLEAVAEKINVYHKDNA